jgi:bifunctional DNA-binding transcriptional regulator/antitoxin component of YhaV-PrlF toxin-antitoxin module
MILTLDAKRRLTVPAALAPTSPGDAFEARFDADEGEIVFRRIAGAGDWLAILSECPVDIGDMPTRRREVARRRRL